MKQTILVIAANPQGTTSLRLDRELRVINDVMQKSRLRDRFDIQPLWATRTIDLLPALLKYKPRIVHFCGHGEGQVGLVLEDEAGTAKLVSSEALAGVFVELAAEVECVLLNACYSEDQAQTIVQYINYAIGMSREIRDDAAIAFTRGFYTAIGNGKPIKKAYDLGKIEVKIEISSDATNTADSRKLIPVDSVQPVASAHLIPLWFQKEPLTRFTDDLFISYAEADRGWVERYLVDALEQAAVRCTHESAATSGEPRSLEFKRGIRQSRSTLLVISAAYLVDDLTRFTDILAQEYGEEVGNWPVKLLTLQAGLQLPLRLKMLKGRLEASSSEERKAAIESLCDQLKHPLPPPAPKPACPYPGMIPFSEDDQGRFFGRDVQIEEVLGKLDLHPFLTVIGPSGSGKSSLIFAGLIPQLKQSGLFGPGQWCIRSLRPGTTPLINLQTALGGDVTNLEVRIQQLLSTQPDAQRLLLVVDQFEELFTQAGAAATSFQQTLLKLVEIPHVYLILTVRADFYPDLMTSALWDKIRAHRVEVLPLDRAGLRKAIVKPAEGVAVYVESALVERLLVDATGEPGVLPLIQATLRRLWEKLERHFLPITAYELLILRRTTYGETKTGLQVAIADLADDAMAGLKTVEKAIARRIFLRLVQFGEGRADTRRQQSIEALQAIGDDPVLFQNTLNRLVNSRLLTLSGKEGETKSSNVDLAHEALISGWSTLQEWIKLRRKAEQARRRLEAQAQEWVRLGQGSGGLLDAIELAEAERWLKSSDAQELGYSPSSIALITHSQQAIQAAIQEKLDREQKSRKAEQVRNRVIIGSLGTILVLGSVAGIFTWKQQQQTQAAKQVFFDQALNIRVETPELIKMLPEFLTEANKLSQQGEKEEERAIAYYSKILIETKKLQQNISNLSTQDRENIKGIEKIENTERSLVALIKKIHIRLLRNQLEQGNIGKMTKEDYPELENQFTTGALQTTYKILMIDTGADANRNGQLDSLYEVESIPCEILQEVENAWQNATQKRCSFYGKDVNKGVNSPSPNCQELGRQNLTMNLLPSDSQVKFGEYLQACKI
jgi:TIR domain/NACHT domain/CHAT domain